MLIELHEMLAATMLVSGLLPDELAVLAGYRVVRDQGRGTFLVRLDRGMCAEWKVLPDLGSAQALNALLGRKKFRD